MRNSCGRMLMKTPSKDELMIKENESECNLKVKTPQLSCVLSEDEQSWREFNFFQKGIEGLTRQYENKLKCKEKNYR